MTWPGMVDTHAHLMDPAFDADREAVVERARAAGVTQMVLVGYDLASSRAAVELSLQIQTAVATVGIHPNSVADASDEDYEAVADLARRDDVVAIGETGLDNYRHFTPPERQRWSFAWHLRLAEEVNKPVVVHNRQADSDIVDLVSEHAATVVLHCFSSTDQDYLDRMLNAGCYASFAGPLTFKNASRLRAVSRRVPADRLLVETDCPYLAPEPHRGRRNEPAYVRDTATCLAELVGMSLELLAERLWSNTLRAFPLLVPKAIA